MSRKEDQPYSSEEYNKSKEIEHQDLLRSIIENRSPFLEEVLKDLKIDLPLLSDLLNKKDHQGDFSLSPECITIFNYASQECTAQEDPALEDHHILLAIARWEEFKGGGLLTWMGGNYVHTQKVVRFLKESSYTGSDFAGPGLLMLGKPE